MYQRLNQGNTGGVPVGDLVINHSVMDPIKEPSLNRFKRKLAKERLWPGVVVKVQVINHFAMERIIKYNRRISLAFISSDC